MACQPSLFLLPIAGPMSRRVVRFHLWPFLPHALAIFWLVLGKLQGGISRRFFQLLWMALQWMSELKSLAWTMSRIYIYYSDVIAYVIRRAPPLASSLLIIVNVNVNCTEHTCVRIYTFYPAFANARNNVVRTHVDAATYVAIWIRFWPLRTTNHQVN
jgi:hypothetical protein